MNLHATVPELPFTVFLHAPNDTLAPVANVTTAPITLTHPNVSLAISGFVLPIHPATQAALSNFISLYLRAQDNPIVISMPFLPGLMFPTTFPAPYPKPQVLRNVTIRNMMLRYSPDGKGGMLASGTGLWEGGVAERHQDFSIGRKHHTHTSDPPPSPPLPSPLPPRALAHIRPDDWLPMISIPVEGDDEEGTTVEVDVPLQVLEGREKEFRIFVGKVIFSSGGAPGVQGTAAVGVRINGLPFKHGEGGEMELTRRVRSGGEEDFIFDYMDPDALSPTQRQALSQLQATNGGNAEYARGVLDGLLLSGMTAVAPITYDLANSLYAKTWGKPWPHQTVGAISMADISQNVEDASISFDGDGDGDGDGAMSLDGDDDNQWDYTVFHGIRSIMAACGAPKFGLDHDVLVIRPEYNLLLEYLEGVSVRGVVATGHQGIGKTLSLIYLLLHRLEHRLPTAIQLGKVVVCFDDKGATTHDPNAERDLTGYWALTDSNHLITTPSSILMKSDLIVQTSSP
ncbi:hypothetical protein EUX98_g7906 [Antrodiella citrinella]|uniref:Uncharacterized protein n=1 Tax=Antrodiella citrinella TaxID=2447956 RepID=A0A4S4MEE5_9APHY|nr:hypothetical protein EUX98_g7906 [Antrodiella citrinella]